MALRFVSKLKRQANEEALPGAFQNELERFRTISDKDSFEVKYSALSPVEISELAKEVRKSNKLERLALIGCRLGENPKLPDLLKSLKRSKSVKCIDFSDNQFGDEVANDIAGMVQVKLNIIKLNLSDCTITDALSERIQAMLEKNKNLVALDLSQNKIGEKGVRAICRGLLNCKIGEKSQIEELHLSGCNLDDASCKKIASLLASCENLVRLSVADNHISKTGVKSIANGLLDKTNGSKGLQFLNVSGNNIGDAGVSSLAQKVKRTNSLEVLFCDNVCMTEIGVQNLCKTVKQTDTVVELGISGNKISEGVSIVDTVIDMCTNTTKLKVLDISGMPLSIEDVKSLGGFIGQPLNCTLVELNLADTQIDDVGAIEIANGLRVNTEIKEIDLTSNPFGAEAIKQFASTFKRAKTLSIFRVTGHSRIGVLGENLLADVLKYNQSITFKGTSRELDYINDFAIRGKCFKWDAQGDKILGWSEDAWEVVKRGCGQVISTAIHNLTRQQLGQLSREVVLQDRNVLGQNMFEYVIRHAEYPALDVVACFVKKCRIGFDTSCGSRTSKSMAIEMNQSDDVSYRCVAAKYAKDSIVQQMAENKKLFLGRYVTSDGPAIHQTHEVSRFLAKDTMAEAKYKDKDVFVQIYENKGDFEREEQSRLAMAKTLGEAGPFALCDTLLKEIEVHENELCVSFLANISDLRHSMNNIGLTAGYNLSKMCKLAKRAAECLGTVNNLGRIHGDFRPRNFLLVAKERMGPDPLGKTSKLIKLPEKWVLFDMSKSVAHDEPIQLRMDSAYLPPEVARVYFHKNHADKQLPLASEKMDVWSFGVVLYQLLTGVHLFHVEQNTDRMYKKSERLELMNWINLNPARAKLILHRSNESYFVNETWFNRMKAAAIDLVNWCLQGDPFNRPTFSEILSHPLFHYKVNVNYTDLDLLLRWYEDIGADSSVASHKNNRTHAHLVNTDIDGCSDIAKLFENFYKKFGCVLTHDANDNTLDISKRKENCVKARTLIVLLTKDVFFDKRVIQKLFWAKDSFETSHLILVDVATSIGSVEAFDFDQFRLELDSHEGETRLNKLVEELTPVEKYLNLTNLNVSSKKKALRSEIKKLILETIENENKVIPYRSKSNLGTAMMNEILYRSGFFSSNCLRHFLLENNDTDISKREDVAEENYVRVLVLFNDLNGHDKVLQDLEKKVASIHGKKLATRVTLIPANEKKQLFKFFTVAEEEGIRVLKADQQTLVLCIISSGFYTNFREEILMLNQAQGLVSVLPIRMDHFDVTGVKAREEVLNIGLENEKILSRLQLNNSYISLPESNGRYDVEYETASALDFVQSESKRAILIARENKDKAENEAFAQYTHSNFFESVY